MNEDPNEILKKLKQAEDNKIFETVKAEEVVEIKKQQIEICQFLEEQLVTMQQHQEEIQEQLKTLNELAKEELNINNQQHIINTKKNINTAKYILMKFYKKNNEQDNELQNSFSTKQLIKYALISSLPTVITIIIATIYIISQIKQIFG